MILSVTENIFTSNIKLPLHSTIDGLQSWNDSRIVIQALQQKCLK